MRRRIGRDGAALFTKVQADTALKWTVCESLPWCTAAAFWWEAATLLDGRNDCVNYAERLV